MIQSAVHLPAEVNISHTVSKTLSPEWVKSSWQYHTREIAEYPDSYLLIEDQTHLEKQEAFRHIAYKLLNDADVQDKSTLKVSFDPAFESLEFHTLKIYRDGEVIDKLAKANIHVVQRENKIEDHLYDGSLTAIIFINDMREGDVLEYAYTTKGFNPIFRSQFCQIHCLQASEPILEGTVRYVISNKQPIFYKPNFIEIKPMITDIDADHKEYVWSLTHIPGKHFESDQPDWHDDFPSIEITTFSKWQEVGEWGERIFALPSHLTTHCPKEMLNLVAEWKKECPKKEDQALKAIRFVQDKVRYLGMENGVSSHQPNDPADVFTNRFGDCKDKTQLLRTFLTLLDIESHPTLVNGSLSKSLKEYLPGYALFNHVILQVVINKQSYWIDSTISYQGGDLSQNAHSNFAYGLILKENTRELVAIPPSIEGKVDIMSTIHLKTEGQAHLEIETKHTGGKADAFRNTYKKWGAQRIAKEYETTYSSFLGQLEPTQAMEIQDDREKNIIVTKEYYLLDQFVKTEEGKTSISIYPYNLVENLQVALDPNRKSPLSHCFPFHVKDSYRIIREDRDWTYEDEINREFVNEAFKYQVTSKASERVLSLDFEYQSLDDHVKPGDVAKHRQLLADARSKSEFYYLIDYTKSTLDKVIAGTSAFAIMTGLMYQVHFYFKRRRKL